MEDFTRGFICAICITLFGKVMYEKGRRKEGKKTKQLGKYKISIEEEES